MKFKIGSRLTRKNIIMMVFSVCLSLVGILTISFFSPSLSKDVIQGLNTKVFSLEYFALLILFVVIFYVSFQLIDRLIRKSNIYKADSVQENQKIFIKVFIINLACWGLWLWVYFPGTGMNDTINCIMSFHNNQPLIYQLIIYYGIQFFTKLTNSMTTAYALLVGIQMILMSMTLALIISWLNKKRIRRWYINLVITYYALMPAVANYSITLVKDTLFSVCILALIPLLYELIEKRGEPIKRKKFYISFLISLLGINSLRSNGKYIVALILFFLILAKIKSKNYILSLILVWALFNSVLTVGEKKLISSDVDFRESIGIPLAQIGAVLVTDGYISETDREVLNNLLPMNIWKENYKFSFADTIKFNENFDNQWLNQNKEKFINSWFSVLKNNLDIYVKAYLCHTYGFWNISPLNITSIDYTQSFFRRINNNTADDSIWGEFCFANNLVNREIKFGTVTEQIDNIFQQGFRINLILGSGIMFWVCVWCVIELIIYRKYKICFVFFPVLMNWATLMVAAPASFIYRYSFYLVLSLPVLFLITLMQVSDSKR